MDRTLNIELLLVRNSYTLYKFQAKHVTSIAPEDGRISPKHVELKELKANKYSIASSW